MNTFDELEDNIVIVLDNSNYKAEYAEKCPFKAKVTQKYKHEIWVKSLKTGKEYELYVTQILECFEDEELDVLINYDNYGSSEVLQRAIDKKKGNE